MFLYPSLHRLPMTKLKIIGVPFFITCKKKNLSKTSQNIQNNIDSSGKCEAFFADRQKATEKYCPKRIPRRQEFPIPFFAIPVLHVVRADKAISGCHSHSTFMHKVIIFSLHFGSFSFINYHP